MNFGSSHLYEKNFDDVKKIIDGAKVPQDTPSFDTSPFETPHDLIHWLEQAKDKKLSRFSPLYEVFK